MSGFCTLSVGLFFRRKHLEADWPSQLGLQSLKDIGNRASMWHAHMSSRSRPFRLKALWRSAAAKASFNFPRSTCLFGTCPFAHMPPQAKPMASMKKAKVKKAGLKVKGEPSYCRMNPFTRGMVWGMHLAGMRREDMLSLVQKSDGAEPALQTIDTIIAKKKSDPEWNGENEAKSGRPPALTAEKQKLLVNFVFKHRGKAKVTIPFCKKCLVFLRKVCDTTVERALHSAGLTWMTRRAKSWVPGPSKEARLIYADWLLARHQHTLDRFAYTDGTTFYLARGPGEHDEKQRAALGRFVWRMVTGKDGLFDDNIGASLYAKAQGLPVKIWGFFCNGRLEYYVLPADGPKKTTHMTGDRYEWLIQSKFAEWRESCFSNGSPVRLVQDHERCLWQSRNLTAMRKAGCDVVENFPKHSPDLNAIEGQWRVLRVRLEATAPTEFESRADFLVRLRRAVHWLNENKHDDALRLCTNQKERANDVHKLLGAKTRW